MCERPTTDVRIVGVYHATPEELAGIDRGLDDARAGRFAADAEVAAVFAKYRPAQQGRPLSSLSPNANDK